MMGFILCSDMLPVGVLGSMLNRSDKVLRIGFCDIKIKILDEN